MAFIENQVTREKVILRSHHVFGRKKAGTDTLLESKYVSQVHASARWEGEQWKILDHSRNGTWVEEKRLVNGENTPLKLGGLVRFGSQRESAWKVGDLSPPTTVLMSLEDDTPILELKRFHILPDEDNPEVSIYLSEQGQWVCESDKGVLPLNEGDLVHTTKKLWRFHCAGPIVSTSEGEELKPVNQNSIRFQFKVSLNEEHVFLSLTLGGQEFDLGERAHHYLLLILARQRLEDGKNGTDPNSAGWIELDQLSDMLDQDRTHVNIQIFRARKQIDKILPEGDHLPLVIERRVGEIRFGYPNFQIIRGSEIEGISNPDR